MNDSTHLEAIYRQCSASTDGTLVITDEAAVTAIRSMTEVLANTWSPEGWTAVRRQSLRMGGVLFAVLAEDEAGELQVTAHVDVVAMQLAWLRARDAATEGSYRRCVRASALEGCTVVDPEGTVHQIDEVLVDLSTGRLTFQLYELDEDGDILWGGSSEVDDLEEWVVF